MVINGKTVLLVNGRPARPCSRLFNVALRAGTLADAVRTAEGGPIFLAAGKTWDDVASTVRRGKSMQVRTQERVR